LALLWSGEQPSGVLVGFQESRINPMSKDSKTPSKPVAAPKPGTGIDPVQTGAKPVKESPATTPAKTQSAGDNSAPTTKTGSKAAGTASGKTGKPAPKPKAGADAHKPIAREVPPTPPNPASVSPAVPAKASPPATAPERDATMTGLPKSTITKSLEADAGVTPRAADPVPSPALSSAPPESGMQSPELAPPAATAQPQASVGQTDNS